MPQTILDQDPLTAKDIQQYRRKLLPVWVVGLSYIFFGFFILMVLAAVVNIPSIINGRLYASFVGMHDAGRVIILIRVFAVFITAGVTSFALLWSKDWAITFGIATAIFNIVFNLATPFISQGPILLNAGYAVLMIAISILFLKTLLSIKDAWASTN